MKLFLKKLIGFAVASLLFFIIITTLLLKFDMSGYLFLNNDWLRIKWRISASKDVIKSDTLIVGCSVAGQFKPFNGNDQLTSNGSTYAAGNYFLIKNALDNNPNIKTVIYMSVPHVIGHKLERTRTYQYFVKPFYTFENYHEIHSSSQTMKVLNQNAMLDLNLFDSYKLLALDDFNYDDGYKKPNDELSSVSIEWLEKMNSLCEQRGVNLHLLSPPVSTLIHEEVGDWPVIRSRVADTGLEKLFDEYLGTVIYIEEKHFRDGLHLKDKYLKANKKRLLSEIFERLP